MLFLRSLQALSSPKTVTLSLAMLALFAVPASKAHAQGNIGNITADATEESAVDAINQMPEIAKAFEKLKARDVKGCKELLNDAFKKRPNLPPPGVLLGTYYYRAKNQAAGRAAYEEAVRDQPNDPEAYVFFGTAALQQGRFTDAILLYKKANEVLPKYTLNPTRKKNLSIRAQMGVARVAEARENWDEAKSALEAVLAMDPNNTGAMTRLGRVLYKQENANEAYAMFKKLYETDPEKIPRFEIQMARLYQADGKNSNAEKLIGRALERDPDSLNTQLNAAQWALENGKMALAEKSATKAATIDPKAVQVFMLKGVIARIKNDSPAAETAFRQAMELSPSNGIVLNQLAISMASQNDPKKIEGAAEFAQMASRLFANTRQALGREAGVTLAWILHRLDKKQAAANQLNAALRSGPIGPDATYFAADVLHGVGQSDVAVRILTESLENAKGVFPAKKQAEALLAKIRGQ
jgi:tetratricopeptide (TPR) repeat protein